MIILCKLVVHTQVTVRDMVSTCCTNIIWQCTNLVSVWYHGMCLTTNLYYVHLSEHLHVRGPIPQVSWSSTTVILVPSHGHAKDQEEPGATNDQLQDVDLSWQSRTSVTNFFSHRICVSTIRHVLIWQMIHVFVLCIYVLASMQVSCHCPFAHQPTLEESCSMKCPGQQRSGDQHKLQSTYEYCKYRLVSSEFAVNSMSYHMIYDLKVDLRNLQCQPVTWGSPSLGLHTNRHGSTLPFFEKRRTSHSHQIDGEPKSGWLYAIARYKWLIMLKWNWPMVDSG